MTVSIKMNEKELNLVKRYARLKNMSVPEVVKKTILEKIEDEMDIALFVEAYNEYEKDPKTHTIKEAKEILDIK